MIKFGQSTVLFLALFVIPLLGFVFYELAIASNRYLSETTIILNSEDTSTTSTTVNLAFLGLPGTPDETDALSVVEFVNSRDMLHFLDQKLHLHDHYSSSRIEWWTRLSNAASFEELYSYMKNWLIVTYDPTSQAIHLELQTFDADYSKAVLDAVLAKSQEFIDNLNAVDTAEQTRFFEQKMVESENRLKQAKQALLDFQRANRLLSTDSESGVILSNITALQTLLETDTSEFDSLAKTLTSNAPRLQQMKSDIEALKSQISIEKDRLSGTSNASVSELASLYSDLQLNLEFITTMYTSNLSQLEQARIEAARHVKFLVTVDGPSIADELQYPNRLLNIVLAAFIFAAVFLIIDLMLMIIREHAT